jgi:hypothetical protein
MKKKESKSAKPTNEKWPKMAFGAIILAAMATFIPHLLTPTIIIILSTAFGIITISTFKADTNWREKIIIGTVTGLTLPTYGIYIFNIYLKTTINTTTVIISYILSYILIALLAKTTQKINEIGCR